MHRLKGAIAATSTVKTTANLPRRATKRKGEVSATLYMKTRKTLLKPPSMGWLTKACLESISTVWATPKIEGEDAHSVNENQNPLGVFASAGALPLSP